MSTVKDKRYCVVDHANKQRERKANRNPNRLKLARERYGRWLGQAPGIVKAPEEGGD